MDHRRKRKPRINQLYWLVVLFFIALTLAHLNRAPWLVIP